MMPTSLYQSRLGHLSAYTSSRCSMTRTFAAYGTVPVRQFPRHLWRTQAPCLGSLHRVSASMLHGGDDVPRKYQGVQRKRSGRYLVRITVDGAGRSFGSFDSLEEAARHRDMHIIRFYGTLDQAPQRTKLNFPLSTYMHSDIMKLKSLEQYRQEWAAAALQEPSPKSRFVGVYWIKARNKWKAQVSRPGRTMSAGQYKTEEEAARKYDELAYSLWGDTAVLNFEEDIEEYMAIARGPAPITTVRTSQYNGVSYNHDRNLWNARLYLRSKQIYNKRFRTEEAAARAYDQAVMQLLPDDIRYGKLARLNFPEEYSSTSQTPPQ